MPEANSSDLVQYVCEDHIAMITLNRPNKLNAFDDDQVRHLAAALRRFDIDNEAYVAIICGRGDGSAPVRGAAVARAGDGWAVAMVDAGALRDEPFPAIAGEAPPFCSSIFMASSGVGISAT